MKYQTIRHHPYYLTIMLGLLMPLFAICSTASATDYLVLDAKGVENVVPRTTVISGMLDIPSGAVIDLLDDRGQRIRVIGPYKGEIDRIGQVVPSSPRFHLVDIATALRSFLAGTSPLTWVRSGNEGMTADPRMLVPDPAAGNIQCAFISESEPVRLWKPPSPESVRTVIRREGTRNSTRSHMGQREAIFSRARRDWADVHGISW